MPDCHVVNFLPFETVSDESLGGVLPFAIERRRRGLPSRGCSCMRVTSLSEWCVISLTSMMLRHKSRCIHAACAAESVQFMFP